MKKNIGKRLKPTRQNDTLEKARIEFKKELYSDDYDILLDAMSQPVDELIRRISKSAIAIPFWAAILILEIIILGLGFGISAAIGEAPDIRIQTLEIFNVLISFCFILLVKSYFDKLKEGFTSEFIDFVNSEKSLNKIKEWFIHTTSRKLPIIWGIIFSIVFGGYLALYGSTMFFQKNEFLGWGPLVLLLLANFPIGTGGYYLWISRNFRVQAKLWDFKIYDPDPSKSVAILKFSKLLFIPVTIIAFLAALTTFAFSVTRLFSIQTLAIAVISGWYPMLSIFIRNHIALASLITRAKQDKLIDLQNKIRELESKSLKSKAGIEYLQKLMDYHDRVANTPNTALNFQITVGFVNTLLLPLIALFISNLGAIINLIQ